MASPSKSKRRLPSAAKRKTALGAGNASADGVNATAAPGLATPVATAQPHMLAKLWPVLLCVVCLMLGAVGWGLHAGHMRRGVDLPAHSPYADSATCTECHAEIAATYAKTGMARTLQVPSSAPTIEDFSRRNSLDHAASGMQYAMLRQGGDIIQRRSVRGWDGRETDVLEERADYIIGSGNQARAYLHRTAQGQLVQLPVSWYSELGGYWAMSPGFDNPTQSDMHGTINATCMGCHDGYPEVAQQAALRQQDRFPSRLPTGIDCQRCHGPGRAHVEAAQSDHASLQQIRSAIVNPARLTRDRQMEVCLQCHLETSNLHAPPEIRAWERNAFSYKPGEPLGDFKLFFERVKDGKDDDFEAAHAGYGLQKSKCYLQSQMTCLTCHNPHDISHGPEAIAGYAAKCQSCHAAVKHTVALPTTQNCISCHMPKRRTTGSVHVVLTDHNIRRYLPKIDLTAPFPEKPFAANHQQVELYYPKVKALSPTQQLYQAVAQVDDGDGKHGLQSLREQLDRTKPARPEPYLELARAHERRGEHREAVRWFDASLQHDPALLAALREEPLALLAAGDQDRAEQVLRHGLQEYPDDDVLLTELANESLRASRLDEAADLLHRALQANPERADVHNLQGLLDLRRNDQAAAETSFREALRLEPRLAEAQNNLAFLLTGRKQFAEAAYLYQQALRQEPNYAEAHHGLGLLLILQGQVASALPELKRAAELQPKSTLVHTDYADALAALGQAQLAVLEYETVLRLQPNQTDAQMGLAMALLKQGRRLEALPLLSRVLRSGDPNLAPLAAQALQAPSSR